MYNRGNQRYRRILKHEKDFVIIPTAGGPTTGWRAGVAGSILSDTKYLDQDLTGIYKVGTSVYVATPQLSDDSGLITDLNVLLGGSIELTLSWNGSEYSVVDILATVWFFNQVNLPSSVKIST